MYTPSDRIGASLAKHSPVTLMEMGQLLSPQGEGVRELQEFCVATDICRMQAKQILICTTSLTPSRGPRRST